MSFSDAFPAGMKKLYVERQLRPGMVVKFEAVMDDQRRKAKRWIVLDVTDTTFTCVINSEVSAIHFGKVTENLQLDMPQAAHDFMSHDSTVDCSRIWTFSTADILEDLEADSSNILGEISSDLRDEVVAALKASPLVSAKVATHCCRALEAADLK